MDEITKGNLGYGNLLEVMPFASDENTSIMPFIPDGVYQQYYTPTVEDIEMPPFPPSLPHWVNFQQPPPNNYVDYFEENSVSQLQMEMPSLSYIEPEAAPGFFLADSSFGSNITKENRSNGSHSRVPAELSFHSLKPHDRARKRATNTDRFRNLRNNERIEALNKLLPHPTKAGKVKKVEQIVDHVKYLQLQIKELSQSRLCDETTSDPFIFLEGHGHYFVHDLMMSNDPLEVSMGKLMETEPLKAMQLLKSKGLCIMPMHLAQDLQPI